MENNVEKKHLDINEYISIIQSKLVECKNLDEVKEIKNKVIPKYIELYNSQKVNTKDLAKISNLLEIIEKKEQEMELFENAEDNVKLMKEYAELLKNMEGAYKALNKKGE